jgi:hypothetical protein
MESKIPVDHGLLLEKLKTSREKDGKVMFEKEEGQQFTSPIQPT